MAPGRAIKGVGKVWFFNWKAYRVRAFFQWTGFAFGLLLIGWAILEAFRIGEDIFIHERELGIQAEETADIRREKDSSCWKSWESYVIMEKEEAVASPYSYDMSYSEYEWLLNMEQKRNTTMTAEWEKETVSEKWINGVWVHRYYEAGDRDYGVHMVFRRDRILLTMTYMPGRTDRKEEEIMEYVAEKVRKISERRSLLCQGNNSRR